MSFGLCFTITLGYLVQYLVTGNPLAMNTILINISGSLLGIGLCSSYHDRILEWINSKIPSRSNNSPKIGLN